MSRTYKHIKEVELKKFYKECWDTLYYPRENDIWYRMKRPGVLPKRRKNVDTEHHWMNTPSWWVNLMMTKPQRREGSLWEREVVKTPLEELDGVDTPNISRKPHIYYW
jgi:hypothetical protein